MLRAKFLAAPLLALTTVLATPAFAQADEAAPTSTVAEAATTNPDLTTLGKALTAAGVAETLNGAGPFTVFAPTDAAFAAVPQAMSDYLMDPANKDTLTQVLTYHVVPGKVTAEDLYKKIKAGGGTAKLTTVEGQEISFSEVQGNIKVDGTQGSSGYVTTQDLAQANGVVHVMNGVLIPNLTPPSAEPAADATAAADAAAAAAEAAATN
jgi:uncharacterized surface protein with fasciclin (FAS1) repeats